MECRKFYERLTSKRVPLHSFILYKDGKILEEWYRKGTDKNTLHRMFSISKSLTALAIGTLIADGRIGIDDKLCDYFPEYVTRETHPFIRELTIRNCLMMRTCHEASTYKVHMRKNWVESFFTVEPTHPAGTVFHYDTSASHVLAALVEKLTGQDMICYVKKRLPELELSAESFMKKDPFDVSMGGSGLCATSRDILNLGIFLMKHFNSDSKDALTMFIKEACSNLTPTQVKAPLPSEACGYGYFIWRSERDGFVLYGMGGQLVICFPQINTIAVTTADTQGIAGGNQIIYDALYEEILPLLDPKGLCNNVFPVTALPKDGLIERINHRNFKLDSEIFSSLRLDFEDDANGSRHGSNRQSCGQQGCINKGRLTYVLRNHECMIEFGDDDNPGSGLFPIYNQYYEAVATWLACDCLMVKVSVNDEFTGSVYFQIFFMEDGEISVYLKKIEESLFKEYVGSLYSVRF